MLPDSFFITELMVNPIYSHLPMRRTAPRKRRRNSSCWQQNVWTMSAKVCQLSAYFIPVNFFTLHTVIIRVPGPTQIYLIFGTFAIHHWCWNHLLPRHCGTSNHVHLPCLLFSHINIWMQNNIHQRCSISLCCINIMLINFAQ